MNKRDNSIKYIFVFLLVIQVTYALQIRGVDISIQNEVEKTGKLFYSTSGDAVDAINYLAQSGVNLIRLRIWNNPYDEQGNPYGGGNNNYDVVAALAKRIKSAGLKFLLDFHYSDFWVDPEKQVKPKAWSSLSVDQLYTAIYEFTVDVLQKLEANGTPPDYVQTGNEINAEMHKITILQMIDYEDRTRTQAEVVRLFQEKYPELPPISQGTVSKIEKQFWKRGHVRQLKKNIPNKLSDEQKLDVMLMLEENPHTSSRMLFPDGDDSTTAGFKLMTNFLTSATNAVRQAGLATTPKIILHLANGCDNSMYQWWFKGVVDAGVNFDIIGLSYYPYWHGTLSALASNLNDLASRFQKDLLVVETAYGFTLDNGDSCPNVFGSDQVSAAGYPATEDGQANFLTDLKSTLSSAGGGRVLGFVYWEPTWLPGPTWATQQGMSYISSSGSEGSNWDNQALFDFFGKALKGVTVFAN
ncbi:hypothetical protein NQ318_022657 [Aromia moschata]|uniref:Arabinogalactan endo-beta-1,4-galactanase n=1 Tax=Aromia moschata TaxID=1265417 RepID=A0AAV8YLT2_9CUCU|nr:hypothetical protein NQ318_022657 [Aromia moschata]